LALRLPPWLQPVFAPALILLAAALTLAFGPTLPPSLAGLKELGPYGVLLLAAALAFWFNRGRAFIAAASLLLAYAGYRFALGYGAAGFTATAVYAAIAVLVPLNVLAALLLPERGVSHHLSYRWVLVAAFEALLVAWIASAGKFALSGNVWHAVFEHWLLRSPPTPWLGRLVFAAAFIAAVWRAWPKNAPLDIGIGSMLAAFFIACEWAGRPGVFGVFVSAAGIVLIVAMVQESHRLAFRDELTGLPTRRALDEALSGLGPSYAIAMVDVDHFKQFNDTYGHDVGDQVLKLVGGRLAAVEGGGRAFRYGGEEFSILFPEANVRGALPHLEQVRKAIESYGMEMRADDRPEDRELGTVRRGEGGTESMLSVTVSIGVAGPDARHDDPGKVIKAADQALYRAKAGGRNRVSV